MTSDKDVDSEPISPSEAPDPSQLDEKTLNTLRKAGFAKPEGVSWGQWMGPRKLNHRHELIAMYAASGKQAVDIAKDLGFTQSRMSIILQTKRMQNAIKRLRDAQYGTSVQARFTAMLPKAVDVVERILDNPNERSATRLKAANELMNRAIGKPKETVEIKTNSVRDVFDYLDSLRIQRPNNALEFSPNQPQAKNPIRESIIDVESTEVSTESQDLRKKIDSWVDSNIPTDGDIGKKGSSS